LVMTVNVYAGGRREDGGMLMRPGVLQIGVDISYPPMEYFGPDGITPRGFTISMAKIIAERLGLRHEFINSSWEGIFAGLDARRWDVIMSSVTITDVRRERHNFSHPYIANTIVMVVRKDANVTATSPEETVGLNVGFQGATTSDFKMQALVDQGFNINLFRYDTIIRVFDDLTLGRLDVVVTDLVVASEYLTGGDTPFQIVWRSPEPDFFAICLRLGNDELTAAINEVLEEMFADGTMLRLSYETFGMDFVTAAREAW